ncbi:MAG: orotidine-5'-phosphate decarboxylase [Planctomycetaceae bacterium]|jgi:orotidine-5'-phosphate decarboxylase|nr:orotidine-5'-phosphate decarboxylase [Planctomycetaceae bacterium]
MSFSHRLTEAVKSKGNAVLVGLDPRYESLPDTIKTGNAAESCERFCREIIDIVSPLVPGVKPQAAFFEQYGPAGMIALERIIRYAKSKGLIVIFDGKRNDIASTAEAYAAGILGEKSAWGADALTVSPYLGSDSIDPFVKVALERDAGIFVLVKTSNPGSGMLQDLSAGGQPIYRHVADYVERLAEQTDGSVGAVVGAVWAKQISELRSVMPAAWFLVPGYGSQGGTANDVRSAFRPDALGAVINNSRGIIFAYQKTECSRWQDAVEAAAKKMIEELAAAEHTRTG